MPQKMKAIILVVLLAFLCLFLILRYSGERSHYRPRVVSAVSSTLMVGTAIVPTLDTPLAKSGNAVWCASFQVAWNHACADECVVLDDLARRIQAYAPDEHLAKLQDVDTLRIPNVVFHVNHEFNELQGVDKIIKNPGKFQGLYINKAFQSIRFRLDKSGAVVISEAYVVLAAAPRHFIVDHPFLIVMKRRSADEPYFVAWIDNAELLEVIEKAETVSPTTARDSIGGGRLW
jgi:hypothetical protein